MIVPRAILVPMALLVALATTTTVFYAGLGEAPHQFFGDRDIVVLGPLDNQVPGRGQVEASLARAAEGLASVTRASPEIYLLTTLQGHSVLARGVELAPFFAMERASLLEGRMPNATNEALVGASTFSSLGLAIGRDYVLPSTFAHTATTIRIVGTFTSAGPSRDEIVLSLDAARSIANLPSTAVHIVRIQSTNARNLSAMLSSEGPSFSYSDVRISASTLLPAQPATIHGNLTNWGRTAGVKLARVHEGEHTLAQRVYDVPARSTVPFSMDFTLDHPGFTNVTLNPTFSVDVLAPTARIAAPATVSADAPLDVTVRGLDDATLEGIVVAVGSARGTTDASGTATLRGMAAGEQRVFAYRGETLLAVGTIDVLAIPKADELANVTLLKVTGIVPPAESIGTYDAATLNVTVENLGGMPGPAALALDVDGARVGIRVVTLPSHGPAVASFTLPILAAGRHVASVEDANVTLDVKVYAGRNPEGEKLLEVYDSPRSVDLAGAPTVLPAEDYIQQLLGNVSLAVFTLSVVTGGMVGLAAIAVLARHLTERAASLGTLKALGGTNEQVLKIATRETLIFASAAAAVGVTIGYGLARAIEGTGLVRAFGHAVHPSMPIHVLAVLYLGSVGFLVLTVRMLLRGLLTRAPDVLMRGRLTPEA